MKTFREQTQDDDYEGPPHHIIDVAGHNMSRLIVSTGRGRCGDIGDGVSMTHSKVDDPKSWSDCEGCWVISFEDLEAFYLAAKAYRDKNPFIEEEEEQDE